MNLRRGEYSTNLICEIREARTGLLVAHVEELADIIALRDRRQTQRRDSTQPTARDGHK